MICSENVNFHELRVAYKFKCDLTHLLQGVHSQSALLQELPAPERDFFTRKQGVEEQKKIAINFTCTLKTLPVNQRWNPRL